MTTETSKVRAEGTLNPLLADDTQFRCTVCGRVGTVGRCCGRDTREPLNDLARAEIQAERKANAEAHGSDERIEVDHAADRG